MPLANIITSNCGVLIAREANKKVHKIEMQEIQTMDASEQEKRSHYLKQLISANEEQSYYFGQLINANGERIEDCMYIRVDPKKVENISDEMYVQETTVVQENELVINYGLYKREILYKGMQPIAISLTELSVLHHIMMSSIYLEAKDIRGKFVEL